MALGRWTAKKPGWATRIRALARPLSVSVLNQVVSSGTNFVFGLYLVRVLEPLEYGLYGIGYAVCLLYVSLGNALFLTQMVVHAPEKHQADQQAYAARILLMVGLFACGTLVLAVPALSLIQLVWSQQGSHTWFFHSVLAASVANLLKDFFIRHAYSRKKETRALVVSCGWTLGLVVILIVLSTGGVRISATIGTLVFAGATACGALAGWFCSGLSFRCISWRSTKTDFLQAFQGGRWALGGTIVTWLQTRANIYVTAMFLGPAGVALINASRIFVSPVTFLVPAVNQIALPRLSEARQKDKGAMLRGSRLYTLGLVALGLGYSLVALVTATKFIPIILGDKYDTHIIYILLVIWCISTTFELTRSSYSNTLQALRDFKGITIDISITAAVSILVAVILTMKFGVVGALIGTAVGELALALLLRRRVMREMRQVAY